MNGTTRFYVAGDWAVTQISHGKLQAWIVVSVKVSEDGVLNMELKPRDTGSDTPKVARQRDDQLFYVDGCDEPLAFISNTFFPLRNIIPAQGAAAGVLGFYRHGEWVAAEVGFDGRWLLAHHAKTDTYELFVWDGEQGYHLASDPNYKLDFSGNTPHIGDIAVFVQSKTSEMEAWRVYDIENNGAAVLVSPVNGSPGNEVLLLANDGGYRHNPTSKVYFFPSVPGVPDQVTAAFSVAKVAFQYRVTAGAWLTDGEPETLRDAAWEVAYATAEMTFGDHPSRVAQSMAHAAANAAAGKAWDTE